MSRGLAGFLSVVVVASVLFPLSHACADFRLRGDAVTHLEWYDDPQGDEALPFYQYLRINLDDTAGGRKFRIYGRLAEDVNNEVDTESRLYFAYFEKKDVWDNTDLRIGRQWVNTVAGSPVLDGLQVRYLRPELFRLKAYGGINASLEDYESDEVVWGFSVEDDFLDRTDLGLSYYQKRVDGDLALEFLGLSAWTRVGKRGSVFGELQYDLLSQIPSYYQAAVRLVPNDRWTFRGEYYGFTPVFDSTSIYSVFAVDDYEEVSVSADYRLDREWTLFARYAREFYESFDDSDVVEAGAELIRPKELSGYLVAVFRTGYEDLNGIRANVRAPLYGEITLDAGAEYNVYDRVGDDRGDTSSKRYWLAGERDLGESLNLRAKVERIESEIYDYYNRGRIRLRYTF
ncbi:MAG: hypothetical protein JSV26_09945 [bacterium]|nr:MAG: hypothetical protein JSV26_09945 [bacterium]